MKNQFILTKNSVAALFVKAFAALVKYRSPLLKCLVAAAFILAIVIWVRKDRPTEPFQRIQPAWIAVSLLLSLGMVILSCWKWRVLLGIAGHRLPFLTLMRFYFIGYAFNNVLLSSIGGDLMRSWSCGERIGDQTDAAVSVFLERFTGLLLLLLLAVFGPLLQPGLYQKPAVIIAVLFASSLLGAIAFFLLHARPIELAQRICDRLFLRIPPLHRLCGKILGIAGGFRAKLLVALDVFRRSPRAIGMVVLLTVAFYLLTWVNVHVAYRVFDVDPAWQGIIAITAVALLAGVLPIAPFGGLGLVTFTYVYFYGLVGLETNDTVAVGILLRLKVILLGLIGLGFYYGTNTQRPPKT